jgi:hypothetical protein
MTVSEAKKVKTSKTHSLAFEALVQSADDVVGLLAYATYKQSIREAALVGQTIANRASRNLTNSMVLALRSSAEQTLTEIVSDGIKQATPDIQNTATIATLNGQRIESLNTLQQERQQIEKHVTARTGFLPAFLTNLAAWVITLIIAVLILYLANSPSVEKTIVDSLDKPKLEKNFPDLQSQPKSR